MKRNLMVEMISSYGVLTYASCLFKALKGVDSLSKEMDDEEKKDFIELVHNTI
jgi:hypothetical protein